VQSLLCTAEHAKDASSNDKAFVVVPNAPPFCNVITVVLASPIDIFRFNNWFVVVACDVEDDVSVVDGRVCEVEVVVEVVEEVA